MELAPDDERRLHEFLTLQSQALLRARRVAEANSQTLAIASGPSKWVGVLLAAAAALATLFHGQLWETLTPGPNYGSGPRLGWLSDSLEGLVPLLGVLAASLSLISRRRGLLSTVLTAILTTVTIVCLLVGSQLVDYGTSQGPLSNGWSAVLLLSETLVGTFVLLQIARLGAPATGLAADGQDDARPWLPGVALALVARPRIRLALFAIPVLAIGVAALDNALPFRNMTTYLSSNVADAVFGLWSLAALTTAPRWSRPLVVGLFVWLVVGFVGYVTPSFEVPTFGFVMVTAGCYVLVCFRLPYLRSGRVPSAAPIGTDTPTRQFLDLHIEMLEREERDHLAQERTLAIAARSARWVALVLLMTLVFVVPRYDSLLASLAHGSEHLPRLVVPNMRSQDFAPLLAALGAGIAIIVGTPRLLVNFVVLGLSMLAMLTLFLDSQVADYIWFIWTPPFWLFVATTSVIGSLVLARIASVEAPSSLTPAGVRRAGLRLPDHWAERLTGIRRRLDRIARVAWVRVLFCVIPALALLLVDTIETYYVAHWSSDHSFGVPPWQYRMYLAGVAVYGAWAVIAAVVSSRARLLQVSWLVWLTLGFWGWNTSLGIPDFTGVTVLAGCYLGLTVLLLREEWPAADRHLEPVETTSPAGVTLT